MVPLLFLAAPVFVGNGACRSCHAEIAKMYESTPMARSTGPILNNVPPGSFRHKASGKHYSIDADGKVTIRNGRSIEHQQFEYAVGSGSAGFSYFVTRDRFLFQAPITWYSQARKWDAAPGFEKDTEMAWDRPIDPSCLLCHASQLTHIYGTFNRYADPPFRQPGVSCERCHGPGSEHVRGNAKMIVPSKLQPERRDDVCRQCHLMGEARVPREGKAFGEYRAGDRLADYVAYFVFDDPDGSRLRTTSHVEKLQASRCKQVSGDRMWCGTCHDTHTLPSEPVTWFRKKCMSCHAEQSKIPNCVRGENCVSCHMPKAVAVDAGHGAFTDHSIPRKPLPAQRTSSQPWKLKPFSAAEAGERELAIAYAELYRRTGDERQKAASEGKRPK